MRLGSIDSFAAQFDQPEEIDYVLGYDSPVGGQIAELRITTVIGQGTVSVTINGQAVTGIDHVAVVANFRSRFSASGLNDFNDGDDIAIRFDAVDNLQDVQATIVTTGRCVGLAERVIDRHRQTPSLIITGSLIGATEIPIVFNPPLRRLPISIEMPIFLKTDFSEDNIQCLSISDISLSGWTYHLSGNAIQGQIFSYPYTL